MHMQISIWFKCILSSNFKKSCEFASAMILRTLLRDKKIMCVWILICELTHCLSIGIVGCKDLESILRMQLDIWLS